MDDNITDEDYKGRQFYEELGLSGEEIAAIIERRSGKDRRVEDLPFSGEDRRVSEDRREPKETQFSFEFAGMEFSGGIAFAVLTALSGLGGTAWAGFEFYKDYMDMREVVQNIDTTEIENRNKQIEIKLDEALDYSRSIKNDLRDDFNRMEKNIDRIEDQQRKNDDRVKEMVDRASERFDTKRESLQSDTQLAIDALEDRLNKKIQTALDNPLAN